MIDYEKKTGAITSKEINLDKIYNTAASAADGLKTVSISDSNQSWKSDKLTYKLLDNDVVMILNQGVPIGFTNVNELKNTDTNDLTKQGYPDSKSGNDDGDLSQVSFTKKMDETFENNEIEVKTVTLTNDQNVDSSYSEEAAAPVEDASSGLTSQEETPTQEQELTATVDVMSAMVMPAKFLSPPIASKVFPRLIPFPIAAVNSIASISRYLSAASGASVVASVVASVASVASLPAVDAAVVLSACFAVVAAVVASCFSPHPVKAAAASAAAERSDSNFLFFITFLLLNILMQTFIRV